MRSTGTPSARRCSCSAATLIGRRVRQALQPVGEVEAVVDTAEAAIADGRGVHACAGIVAGADLTLGADVSAVLDAMREVAGRRLSGIRNSVAWHPHPDVRSSAILPPPHLMADPRYRAGVRCLSRHNLSLDVWAYQTQHDELLDLAIANPDTTIVIDHLGGPVASGPYRGKRDEMFAGWKDGLKALAALPNTRLKLGGLGMRVGGFDFHEAVEPPTSLAARRCVASLCRDRHRVVRAGALHVREQFSRRQGHVQLSNVLERLQASCRRREPAARRRPCSAPPRSTSTSSISRGFHDEQGLLLASSEARLDPHAFA